ncbi:large membrane protein [Streptomyces zinciresistens K42]|uniref:Large membrane protein n=1 Tax=Streptomyces zinciresistens K42 TaxID=700597 RepID=G2G7U6_9ACTN|nr:hypothetical protein [Streptomyces zinciresistens]EGX60379.1 large membrane protein [Streptomyces zinciresistens K42]
MNTERPENDDTGADGSAEERDAREQQDTAGAGGPDTAGPGGPDTAGAGSGESAGPVAPGEPAGPGEGGDAVPSRRRSPVLIASVAAAVLLAGGGGAYLAADLTGGPDAGTSAGARGDGTPPPLRLDGSGADGGGTRGVAPGEPNPYGVLYRAAGKLPEGPGSAPVYRASGEVGAAEVARLAEALGVDGTPVARGQSWRVGAKDGAGPTLQVTRTAPADWTFSRYAPGADDCRGTTVCAKGPGGPSGEPVSEEAAKKAAGPVLRAVGQGDARLDASQVVGARRVVNADPVVGGLPTYGWSTGVTVDGRGDVVAGSGRLKAPVKGDGYPVLSARKTLALLNRAPEATGRTGVGGCASAVPLDRSPGTECGTGAPGSARPSARGTGKDTVTVEKAVFGLAARTVDGRQALVPSWLFAVRGADASAVTVTHPAVDPAFLAPAAPGEEPAPRPSGPKDEPAPVTRNVTVDGYTVDGSELTVAFTGGVCADYKVTAAEDGGRVTVRVTETTRPEKVCIMIAKVFRKTVRLEEPLGDRKVVGTDGRTLPLLRPGVKLPDGPQTSGAR